MEAPSKFIFHLIYLMFIFPKFSYSAKIIVDGVSEWRNPSVTVGDTITFKHRYNYRLYIFRSESAFEACNFTQATMLTSPNSTSFIWHTSRPGIFYFSFNNNSFTPCLQGQKYAVKVITVSPPVSPPSPQPLPCTSPAPIPGGIVSSSPAFPWPFKPRETTSPSPAPTLPENGGTPFINSNPAVPLPTGEVDSATIRPVSTSSHNGPSPQVVGLSAVHKVLCCVLFMMLL